MPRTERWTLKSPQSGEVLTQFIVEAEPVTISEPEATIAPSANRQNAGPATPAPSNGERMTDPQKRYLFRLLGAQGVEGKKAEDHLKTYFKVTRLIDIDRQAASAYIDQLVKDRADAAS